MLSVVGTLPSHPFQPRTEQSNAYSERFQFLLLLPIASGCKSKPQEKNQTKKHHRKHLVKEYAVLCGLGTDLSIKGMTTEWLSERCEHVASPEEGSGLEKQAVIQKEAVIQEVTASSTHSTFSFLNRESMKCQLLQFWPGM